MMHDSDTHASHADALNDLAQLIIFGKFQHQDAVVTRETGCLV
jgi:hypothetical protein